MDQLGLNIERNTITHYFNYGAFVIFRKGLFTIRVPKKGKKTPRLLSRYFLQIKFI